MRSIFLGLILIGLPLPTTGAQESEAPSVAPATAVAPSTAVAPLPELRSPRATLHTFLRAMRDNETDLAISCLT